MRFRVTPPLVFLLTLAAMYFLARYVPLWRFDFPGKVLLEWVFSLMAVGFALAGIMAFARAKTAINPKKASRLVTSGVYRYSRNPIYLGLLLLLVAIFLNLSALSSLIMIPVFVIYMNSVQIAAEERVLTHAFGQQYKEYCQHVRRWC
ncbi:isoprenylcysteine carboxylmethyltransferase family protein [Photobacterium sp. 1_MG-2023]|uniref:methyltransferase family protein n=1 Tax=Photobacterium sp. 1_MG-2023 TaxID=3062646 RepID=UPI0026E1560A|nr:isoprenylcysteine carboxylmethyltransferase family protein [Photobacterium sp. 1_MG-2023]MDO6706813.1 isoprenylcysteine carboxylmethyltransferase family protein [Photobacterium sp. 1_MG-2023]